MSLWTALFSDRRLAEKENEAVTDTEHSAELAKIREQTKTLSDLRQSIREAREIRRRETVPPVGSNGKQ